jgi:hypothetical protein
MGKTKKYTLWLAELLILGMVFSSAGCKKAPSDSSSEAPKQAETAKTATTAAPAPKAATKPARPELLSEGQKAVLKDVEITLLGSRRPAEHTKTPPEGKGYIVLKFRVKNTSELQWWDAVSET